MKKTIKNFIGKNEPQCGLCGKTKNLIKTECCNTWICDDEGEYKTFSYARNSCYRNHHRYTLCGYHNNEEHSGNWQDCQVCKESFETEMYVWYGTNEYNFAKLKNPPNYEPTKCASCGEIIILSKGVYSSGRGGYLCGECTNRKFYNIDEK